MIYNVGYDVFYNNIFKYYTVPKTNELAETYIIILNIILYTFVKKTMNSFKIIFSSNKINPRPMWREVNFEMLLHFWSIVCVTKNLHSTKTKCIVPFNN